MTAEVTTEDLQEEIKAAEKALSMAKIGLMSEEKMVFLFSVLLGLKQVITKSIPTAATDGLNILINPTFFLGLKGAEREFLLMHEVFHVILKHMLRLGDRNPRKFNCAADYAINLQLVDLGMQMPSGGLLDKKYRNMSAEAIYDALPESPEPPPMEDLIMVSDPGSGTPGTGNSEGTVNQQIDDLIVRAATQAEMSKAADAYVPEDVARYLKTLKEPKLPWYQILRKFMYAHDKTRRTYRKRSRRYSDVIMPTRYGESVDHLAVVIDTSGSVSPSQFSQFISEVHGITTRMNPKKMTIIQFSTGITAIDEVKTMADLAMVKFKGGGGTNIQPVCDWVGENKPKVVLCFTDGWFHPPQRSDNTNWVWLINDNPNMEMTWGKTIHFETME